MKVKLINYTPMALETLLYTKDTRLQGGQTIDDIYMWPMDKKLDHLDYMKDTIQSSWEFVDYTFHITGVTRAFTHQLVRTRTGAYAQESQRTIDASEHEVINTISDRYNSNTFDMCAREVMGDYQKMINEGIAIQDARGILPTNISTSIISKFSLRTLHDMALLRLCTRTQGEYQRVFKAMRDEVVAIHPWARAFIKVHCAWYGSCAFPRYKDCPVKWEGSDDQDSSYKVLYQNGWDDMEHEATPVAKDGKTQ